MKKINSTFFVILIASVLIVVVSLYQPRTFNNDTELANISCGLPLHFIQGASLRNPPFPFHTNCIEGFYTFPRENSAQILWTVFFLDVAIVFGLLSLIVHGYHIFGKPRERKVGR